MIRVLHMIGSLEMGGSQSMIMNLYRCIDKTKIQFDFVVDRTEHMEYENEIKKLGGIIYVMPTFYGVNFVTIINAWNDFLDKHSEYKILHSHVRSYASLYFPIAKKKGLTTIIHSHNTSNGRGLTALVKDICQFPLRMEADYFFACSDKAGEWLFGKKIIKSNRYYLVRNAIDINKFKENMTVRSKIRKDLNIGNDDFVCGHVGRFVKQKNHSFLINLFKKMTSKVPNSKLILVGDGPLKSEISNLVEQCNLTDRVFFLGNRNDVNNILQACDVMLFPSLNEGLPVTIIESQAASLPCYISNKITKEVSITKLVKRLPINKGVDIWVNAVSNSELVKYCAEEEIRFAGYDINQTTKWISDFYSNIW